MKRIALPLLILALVACSTSAPTTSTVPGHGAISIRIDPNPIVATNVRGDTYDFPFEVIVRETGGRAVNIQRVTATVRGPGGFALGNESWSAEKIHDMGYPTSV